MAEPTAALLSSLLAHAAGWSDKALQLDLADCVLPVARADADRAVLREYLRLRRRAPHWKPGVAGHNNHAHIPAKDLKALLAKARASTPVRSTACETCDLEIVVSRRTRRFCSAVCRKRAHRSGGRDVTLSAENGPTPTDLPTPPKTAFCDSSDLHVSEGLASAGSPDSRPAREGTD